MADSTVITSTQSSCLSNDAEMWVYVCEPVRKTRPERGSDPLVYSMIDGTFEIRLGERDSGRGQDPERTAT